METTASFELGSWGSVNEAAIDSTVAITDVVQAYFSQAANCARNNIFSHANHVVVGMHIGSRLEHSKAASALIQLLTGSISASQGVYEQIVLQHCGANSDRSLGITVNTKGNLTAVQKHMRDWSDGNCIKNFEQSKRIESVSLLVAPRTTKQTVWTNATALQGRYSLSHFSRHGHVRRHVPALHSHHRRSTCSYVQVVSGDSCSSLVQECGITAAEFTEYNPASDLCSTLAVGQYVCCSEGDLPDFSPKPFNNGTCYTYTVQAGDYCAALASTYSITVDAIESFNNQTWGWMGCNDLQAGQTMCLSYGEPPFPTPIANAVCGPQVPGTQQPTDDTSPWLWASLNPCPLNACCDMWGQCGITPAFCTMTESTTGAPGTAAAGSNGCINDCGTTITNDADPPAEFMAVGYYEGFNYDRDSLVLPAYAIDTTKYTHVHYAFGNISSNYEISITDNEDTFNDFLLLTNVKRILSFGGWTFSTDPSTYSIFRNGVTASNRQTLANNVVDFVEKCGLDGVDFDWEYPGEPDIEGTSIFLQLVKLSGRLTSHR